MILKLQQPSGETLILDSYLIQILHIPFAPVGKLPPRCEITVLVGDGFDTFMVNYAHAQQIEDAMTMHNGDGLPPQAQAVSSAVKS